MADLYHPGRPKGRPRRIHGHQPTACCAAQGERGWTVYEFTMAGCCIPSGCPDASTRSQRKKRAARPPAAGFPRDDTRMRTWEIAVVCQSAWEISRH